tara:strand:- start:208 stop:357 length:150 start_codon:yes stop_codon:yes gene_type:complete
MLEKVIDGKNFYPLIFNPLIFYPLIKTFNQLKIIYKVILKNPFILNELE